MPFDNEGKWREPTVADKEKFLEDLLSPTDHSVVLPDSVRQAILDYTEEFGIKGTHHSLYDSFYNATKDGIGEVDIVIPVYGGLSVLKPCINSIVKNTYWPYNLILVDDATPDDKVPAYLSQLTNATVITNKKNRGFAASVNRGIKAGKGKYICVCNSDILVTPKWLLKMVLCLEADKTHQIVNPVTNNTALIAVPMKPGASYLDMNRALEIISQIRYNESMPTGFCWLMRRKLAEEIGYFDMGYTSYGEDSSFWVDTLKHINEDGSIPKYKAVLADNTYIFHERSSSFSALGPNRHMGLRQKGSSRFRTIHPDWQDWNRRIDIKKSLRFLRKDYPPGTLKDRRAKYSVAYIVRHTGMSGGMKFVCDIVNALIEHGVDAKVVCIKREPGSREETLQELRTAPIFFDKWEDCVTEFPEKVFEEGIVIASTGEVIKLVNLLKKTYPKLTTVHHAQSDDVAIAPDRETADKIAGDIGKLDHTVASSNWVAEELALPLGKKPPVILPGVDQDLFYPRGRHRGDDRPTVMIPMIDTYPYKGYDRGVELIKALEDKATLEIRILVCGADRIKETPTAIGLGFLDQSRMAEVLGTEVDVFCDPSHIHSYGMPALEAIASGVNAISWDNMGSKEIERFHYNVLASDASPEDMADCILGCLRQGPGTGKKSLEDLTGHNRHEQVKKFVKYLDTIAGVADKTLDVVVVTPHMRKVGGPTTLIRTANELSQRGHKVTMSTVYTDINPSVLDRCNVPVSVAWDNLRPCEVAVVNSDNDKAPQFFEMPQVKKRVMLKLSHNPRFQILENENLNLPWDHIITSTEWLRQACISPMEGWIHKAWDNDKVTRVGWFHYDHGRFDRFNSRVWGTKEDCVTVGFLFHTHILKGTQDCIDIVAPLKEKYNEKIHVVGVGEMQITGVPGWIQYEAKPSRNELANIMSHVDIWLSCSHTEGLGRMNLEAMSAGCAIVATDTGAEFLRHGENALIFPVKDVATGAGCVERLFLDSELANRLRRASYETASLSADPMEYIRNIEKILGNV